MLRKFRNLDKLEILQNAVNCLTVGNERLKKENENLEYKLELTKNYWEKWQKGFEAEHKRVEGLLATKEFENEELNEKYVSETDLAKVKIYDLRKEVESTSGQLAQAEQISEDRLLIIKDLKEKIAKQDIQLNLKKEALSESESERVKLRKWNQQTKALNESLEEKNDELLKAEKRFESENEYLKEDVQDLKSEVAELKELLEAFKTDAVEWEEIAKTRGDEINDLQERIAFYEEVEDGNVHEYQAIIAKQNEQIKNLRRGMKK